VAEFATHPEHQLSLRDVAASTEARLIADRVVLVDEERRRVLTGDGDWIEFDHLLLAVGARELETPTGWVRWPSGGDPAVLQALIAAMSEGSRRIAVLVPAGSVWPLAGFELSLILAEAARAGGIEATVRLISELERPLEWLGPTVEEIVDSELRGAGVEVLGGVRARPAVEGQGREGADWFSAVLRRLLSRRTAPAADRPASFELRLDGGSIAFDRVISLPASIGPDLGGVPADGRGFVPVDAHCRVAGSDRVWAAGDCTSLPLKHSTLAVSQGDTAADAVAAAIGAPLTPAPFDAVLSGIVVSGAAGRWRAESRWLPPGLEPATHCIWWPPGKVLGGRLARYVAARDPSARPLLITHPRGAAVRIELDLPSRRKPADPDEDPRPGVGIADSEAVLLDTYARRVQALRRVEHEADERLEELEAGLERQRARRRDVLARLNAAGYLVKASSVR
jgi:sulfide:quinone oxidoreductase